MGGIRWIDACHFGDCRMLMTRMAADGIRVQTVVTMRSDMDERYRS